MFTVKHVTALTSDRRHVPAVNIIRLTTEVALKTLVGRPREEVMLSGPGLKKNEEKFTLALRAWEPQWLNGASCNHSLCKGVTDRRHCCSALAN
jgi:hypothetical protein